MGHKTITIFGIVLLFGLGLGQIIDANSIQEINGQIFFENVSCYTCEDAACNVTDITKLPVQACNLSGAECVTTFFNNAVSARGCSNLLSAKANATCVLGPGQLCFTCVSSLCNVAMSANDFIDCYQCDSYSNGECVWKPSDSSVNIVNCFETCIVALLPKSSSDNATYETYRGCSSDLSGLGISTCDGVTDNCWNCSSSKCNSFNEPTDRLSCNFCLNGVCNDTFSQTCLSYREDDKCAYVLNSNGTVSYLACASNFDPATLEYMMGLGVLVECNGANCNNMTSAPNVNVTSNECMSCTSQQNEYCATQPTNINSTIQCDDLNNMCVTRITDDGHTMRGCVADLSKTDFLDCNSGSNSTYCAVCNATSCNDQIFPANRLSCYQCNSGNDGNCESNPTNATICPIYSTEETCTQYMVNTTTYRGCSSQLPCAGSKCTTCNTSACNNKDLTDGSATIQLTGTLLLASILVFVYQGLGL